MTNNPLQLTHADYKKVLKYYNQQIPRSYRKTKKNAESLLTNKLCKCIQKVKKTMKQRNKSLKNTDHYKEVLEYVGIQFYTKKMLMFINFNVIKHKNLEIIQISAFLFLSIESLKIIRAKSQININTSEKESEVKV